MAPQFPFEDLAPLLVGKVVRVWDDTEVRALGVCTVVHAPLENGSVDVEFSTGSRFGFFPDFRDGRHAEGWVSTETRTRRGFQVVEPAQRPWHFRITAGPSREELFDSLRLYKEQREVPFTVEGRFRFTAMVQSIEVEDGSGNSWNLILRDTARTLGGMYLKAYFHTTRRTGTVQFLQ